MKRPGRIPLVLVYLLSIAIVVSAFAALSYSWNVDIDITSARLRHQERIGAFVFAERIEETSFSEFVAQLAARESPPKWRPVGRVTRLDLITGCHTCYRYTCLPSCLRDFVLLWRSPVTEKEQARQEALQILNLLQADKPEAILHRLTEETSVEKLRARRKSHDDKATATKAEGDGKARHH